MRNEREQGPAGRPSLGLLAGLVTIALGTAACKCGDSIFTPSSPEILGVTPSCDLVEGGARVVLDMESLSTSSIVFAAVLFGGRAAVDVAVLSPTEIGCTVPEAAGPGVVDVELDLQYSVAVRGPDRCAPQAFSRSASLAAAFEYVDGVRPVVTGVENRGANAPDPCLEPDEGGEMVEVTSGCEDGNELVHVLGSGFVEESSVSFGAAPALAVTYLSSTHLVALTPPGTAGEVVNVTVSNPHDTCDMVSLEEVPFCYTQCATATPSPVAEELSFAVSCTDPRVAVGDVVGAGEEDVVVAGTTSSGGLVEVLEGDGTGSLAVSHSVALPGKPSDVILADFDTDGDLDAAVTLADRDVVAVLWNDGGFDATRMDLPPCGLGKALGGLIPDEPAAVRAFSLDGDGELDLVVANPGSSTIGVLLGDGAGGFAGVVAQNIVVGGFGSPSSPTSLAAADLDGDGDLDLVTGTDSADAVVQLEYDAAVLSLLTSVATVDLPAPGAVVGVALDDFFVANELIVVDEIPSLHLMQLDATGVFDTSWSVDLFSSTPAAMAMGEVFGGSEFDLVLACAPNVLQSIPAPPGSSAELAAVSAGSGTVVDVALGRLNSRDPATHDDAVLGISDGRVVVVLNTADGYD